jgi:hypothetical protein
VGSVGEGRLSFFKVSAVFPYFVLIPLFRVDSPYSSPDPFFKKHWLLNSKSSRGNCMYCVLVFAYTSMHLALASFLRAALLGDCCLNVQGGQRRRYRRGKALCAPRRLRCNRHGWSLMQWSRGCRLGGHSTPCSNATKLFTLGIVQGQ